MCLSKRARFFDEDEDEDETEAISSLPAAPDIHISPIMECKIYTLDTFIDFKPIVFVD